MSNQATGDFNRIYIQDEALLGYMESHSRFAAHKVNGLRGVEQRSEQWERLAEFLNDVGPIKKSPQAWERYYKDLKSEARKYKGKRMEILKSTGNQTYNVLPKNLLYDKTLLLVGANNNNGLSLTPEVGTKWISRKELVPKPVAYHPIFRSAPMPQITIHQNYYNTNHQAAMGRPTTIQNQNHQAVTDYGTGILQHRNTLGTASAVQNQGSNDVPLPPQFLKSAENSKTANTNKLTTLQTSVLGLNEYLREKKEEEKQKKANDVILLVLKKLNKKNDY